MDLEFDFDYLVITMSNNSVYRMDNLDRKFGGYLAWRLSEFDPSSPNTFFVIAVTNTNEGVVYMSIPQIATITGTSFEKPPRW